MKTGEEILTELKTLWLRDHPAYEVIELEDILDYLGILGVSGASQLYLDVIRHKVPSRR